MDLLRTISAKRYRAERLLVLFALTGCELIAGLAGNRDVSVLGDGGAGDGSGPLETAAGNQGSATPVAGQGGAPGVGLCLGGAQAPNGGEGGALSDTGGRGGDANSCEQRALAGAAGETDVEEPSLLTALSCAGPIPQDCEAVNPCTTLRVPGGTFEMGRSEDCTRADYFPSGSSSETPEHSVSLGPYWLDKYEVTVARFRRFVQAYSGRPSVGAGKNPHVDGSGWQAEWNEQLPADGAALLERLDGQVTPTNFNTWSHDPGAGECRPINFIDWYLAFAFCAWDGGRLPTEAEWELAAAGGAEERLFPWGSSLELDGRAVYACSFSGSSSCTTRDLPHVGSVPRGSGRFGHADLAGSLGEPVRDQFELDSYSLPGAASANPIDLLADAVAGFSPLRGGYFSAAAEMLRAAARLESPRSDGEAYIGVRCARDL
jgi:sulfatase modifying factor 1